MTVNVRSCAVAIILAVAGLGLGGSAAWAGSDGAELVVAPTASVYREGEPVTLVDTVTNRSGAPASLPSWRTPRSRSSR